jgi:uncharacterized protein (TIGR02646 family)
MIIVDRKAATPPGVLTGNGSTGANETVRAITFYSKKGNSTKGFSFKIYGHEDVKTALEQLFHKKCAYCESPYGATQPVDVEHWRPKGAIENAKGKKEKPAYFWLASDWDNLLPSCIDCNRRRYQVVPGSHKQILLGKENQFPLVNEQMRAKKPGDEVKEDPLLLNPCNTADDPTLHLEFIEGPATDKAVLKPRLDAKGQASSRGLASIQVYALNRTELVEARRRLFIDIEGKLSTIHALMLALDTATLDLHRQIYEGSLNREMEALRRMKDPDSPYSALAKQIIDKGIRLLTR